MVSPERTLQSSSSRRNSIASLAWFSASCIGCSCRPGRGCDAGRVGKIDGHICRYARGTGSILPTRPRGRVRSTTVDGIKRTDALAHPTSVAISLTRGLLRGFLLGRVLPGVAVALGLGLEAQLAQLLAVAHAVA